MALKPLFATKSPTVIPGDLSAGLRGFKPVTYTPEFVSLFKKLYSQQTAVLYNHSPIYPWAYLNKGQMRLFVNEDYSETKIIPVVQKFKNDPQFSLYTPMASVSDILAVVTELNRISKHPVDIIDVTHDYALLFTASTNGWKAVKMGDDVIQDTSIISSLSGRGFSSIRNALKHVRNDLKPRIERLDRYTYKDAIKVFQDWKDSQGMKYFRVTIGRDIRLMEECNEWVDERDFFGYVYYVDEYPRAANFGCRSWTITDYGMDVTCKADITCKGLGDFAFQHLASQMARAGIRYLNDSGCTTAGNRISKGKWQPPFKVPMFNLVPA